MIRVRGWKGRITDLPSTRVERPFMLPIVRCARSRRASSCSSYACHEGDIAMTGILNGARKEEEASAAGPQVMFRRRSQVAAAIAGSERFLATRGAARVSFGSHEQPQKDGRGRNWRGSRDGRGSAQSHAENGLCEHGGVQGLVKVLKVFRNFPPRGASKDWVSRRWA